MAKLRKWRLLVLERVYSSEALAEELAWLAACSVRIAHDFHDFAVDPLDMTLYRETQHRFELVDGDFYWEQVGEFVDRIDSSPLPMLQRATPIEETKNEQERDYQKS